MEIGKLNLVAGVLLAVAAGRCYSAEISVDLRPLSGQAAYATMLNAAANTTSDDGVVRQHRLSAGSAKVRGLAVGDLLVLGLFEDRELRIELVSEERSLVGRSFLGRMQDGLGLVDCVVLETENGLVVDVTDSKNNRVWKVISDASGVRVEEVEPTQRVRFPSKPLQPPEPGTPIPEVEVNTKDGETTVATNRLVMPPPNVSSSAIVIPPAATSLTTVDIMVAYDTDAASWARSNGGGIQTFAETCVQKMNTAIANTGLNSKFAFRLVGTYEVGGSAGGDLTYALYYASGTYSGTLNGVSWSGVAQKRDAYGADIVCVLVDTGSAYGTTGLGWSLQASTRNPASCGCNACSIRSVAQSHTMTHEVGHNMGAGHSDQMADKDNCGPQYHSYSSGYYFTANGTKYYTIMAYNTDGYGNYYTEVPYFSSPDYTYRGVAVGDATHNNSKTLSLTYSTIANNRQSVIDPDIPPAPTGPVNDNFSAATSISGNSGAITASNVGATKQSGEPLLDDYSSATTTVWWKWTAPSNGSVKFDTIGSSFDTVMGIYTGTSLSALNWKADDDDGGGNFTSMCSFSCTGGTTYYICVGGYSAATGTIKLNWNLTPSVAPPTAPTSISVSTWGSDNANTSYIKISWSVVTGATRYDIYRSTANARPSSPFATNVTTPYYDYKTTSGLVPGRKYYYWVSAVNSAGTAYSSSDWGNILTSLSLGQSSVSALGTGGQANVSVTANTSWSATKDVSWITFNSSSGSGNGTLSFTVGANSGTTARTGTITVTAASGETYSATKTITVTQAARSSEPRNNRFSSATVISGYQGTSGGSNEYAFKESGEPNHAGYSSATSSIWWKWTAPYKGEVQVDTIGSSIDTVLAVYTGSSVSALTSVAYDDDNGEGLTSRVDFNATKGTTYYIAVSGVSGEYGDIVLNLKQFPDGQTVISKAGVSADGKKMQLAFKAQKGKTYYVQRTTSLTNGGSWTTIQTITPSATSVKSVEVSISASNQSGFYRIATAE